MSAHSPEITALEGIAEKFIEEIDEQEAEDLLAKGRDKTYTRCHVWACDTTRRLLGGIPSTTPDEFDDLSWNLAQIAYGQFCDEFGWPSRVIPEPPENLDLRCLYREGVEPDWPTKQFGCPRKMPRTAQLVGAFDSCFSPGSNSEDQYYISTNRNWSRWFLWWELVGIDFDDLFGEVYGEDGETLKFLPVCHCQRRGVKKYMAAYEMLKAWICTKSAIEPHDTEFAPNTDILSEGLCSSDELSSIMVQAYPEAWEYEPRLLVGHLIEAIGAFWEEQKNGTGRL